MIIRIIIEKTFDGELSSLNQEKKKVLKTIQVGKNKNKKFEFPFINEDNICTKVKKHWNMLPYFFKMKARFKSPQLRKNINNKISIPKGVIPQNFESNTTYKIYKIFHDINKRNKVFNLHLFKNSLFPRETLNGINFDKFRTIIMGKILHNSRNLSFPNETHRQYVNLTDIPKRTETKE